MSAHMHILQVHISWICVYVYICIKQCYGRINNIPGVFREGNWPVGGRDFTEYHFASFEFWSYGIHNILAKRKRKEKEKKPKEINGLVSASFKTPDAGFLWNSLKDEDEMQTHEKLKRANERKTERCCGEQCSPQHMFSTIIGWICASKLRKLSVLTWLGHVFNGQIKCHHMNNSF